MKKLLYELFYIMVDSDNFKTMKPSEIQKLINSIKESSINEEMKSELLKYLASKLDYIRKESDRLTYNLSELIKQSK